MAAKTIVALARLAQSICRWGTIFTLLLITSGASGADAPPLQICLLSASAEYESDKSLRDFQAWLETQYRVVCHQVFGKDKGDTLPGIAALESADLMIVFTRRVTLPPAELAHLQKYLAAGRPVIGLRTASHAFQNYPEFDREILGGGYKGHYTNAPAAIQLSLGRAPHPILAGVTDFNSRKLYKNPTVADDVVVLLNGVSLGNQEPVAWVRERPRRVFATSLGTPEDFSEASFRRLLVNAIFWTTQRDETDQRRTTTIPAQPVSTQK
jgi:type 1 glutamine amidotransferase